MLTVAIRNIRLAWRVPFKHQAIVHARQIDKQSAYFVHAQKIDSDVETIAPICFLPRQANRPVVRKGSNDRNFVETRNVLNKVCRNFENAFVQINIKFLGNSY